MHNLRDCYKLDEQTAEPSTDNRCAKESRWQELG